MLSDILQEGKHLLRIHLRLIAWKFSNRKWWNILRLSPTGPWNYKALATDATQDFILCKIRIKWREAVVALLRMSHHHYIFSPEENGENLLSIDIEGDFDNSSHTSLTSPVRSLLTKKHKASSICWKQSIMRSWFKVIILWKHNKSY